MAIINGILIVFTPFPPAPAATNAATNKMTRCTELSQLYCCSSGAATHTPNAEFDGFSLHS